MTNRFDTELIKKYLLNRLEDESVRDEIELQLLQNDAVEEQILLGEDELIDDYVGGELTASDRLQFEKFFLTSADRDERLRFAQKLQNHLRKAQPAKQSAAVLTPLRAGLPFYQSFSRLTAVAAVVLISAGLGLWYFLARQPTVDKNIAAVNETYREKRPFDARISEFTYAPLAQTRGGDDQSKSAERKILELTLLQAAQANKNAAALYALGKYYLAEKNLSAAVENLNQTILLEPNNAAAHSDLAAAYLELGKKTAADGDGKTLEYFDHSLEHSETAIRLNVNLPEPRFNRALVLEALPMIEGAKTAWRQYLEVDANSRWADEARIHLQKLETQKPQSLNADELETRFLAAFSSRDETEAARLIGDNRELIKEKYLPQRLARSFVEAASGEKKRFLDALVYAGELEKVRISDFFAADLAAYYRQAAPDKIELLKSAHAELQTARKLLLDANAFNQANAGFTAARLSFLAAGDVWEARICEFFIVYCLGKIDRIGESVAIGEKLVEFCQQKSYKWLQANTLYWLAGAQRVTAQRERARANHKICLRLAEEINDAQMQQKILLSLAAQRSFVGQNESSLVYLQKAFKIADHPGGSLREKWRTYGNGADVLAKLKLYSLAKAIALESIEFARELNENLLVLYSQLDAGVIFTLSEDFDDARALLIDVRRDAVNVTAKSERLELLVKSLLMLAFAERKRGDLAQSAAYNEEALQLVETAAAPRFLYDIEKSRLETFLAAGDDAAVEKLLPATIELTEKYRSQILEEQERNTFFGNEQNVYDLAVAFENKRGDDTRAYNYLETSNSRSLLDWLHKGARVNSSVGAIGKIIEITFDGISAAPLNLDEIRRRMPAETQLLQFAVLPDKTIIWLISREKVAVAETPHGFAEINQKVAAYVQLLANEPDSKERAAAAVFSRELFDWLIKPIFDRLDQSKSVCVIPHKSLFRLPFAALLTADNKYLIEKINLFYAPSANVFLHCTENARSKTAVSDETIVSVGNPLFDRREFADLDTLPAAETEARDAAALYPKSISLIGAAATKTAFAKALPNGEIVHFAGHYLVKRGEATASSLILAPAADNSDNGVLTNAELMREKLPRAKLIVLSACQTGVEEYFNGEGLIGLSRTFLAAGAPLVVASQWQVDSDATAHLMIKFHQYRRRENLPSAAALRRAQLDLIHDADARLQAPYFWAAFAAFGGFTEF